MRTQTDYSIPVIWTAVAFVGGAAFAQPLSTPPLQQSYPARDPLYRPAMAYDGNYGVAQSNVCPAWIDRTTPPGNRRGFAMVYDEARGETVVFGGVSQRDTWTWNGDAWMRKPTNVAPPSASSLAVYDSARELAVMFTGTEVWEWNGASWSGRPDNGPLPRNLTAVAYDPVRRVVVLFGGSINCDDPGGCSNPGDTWEWDGIHWSQVSVTGPSGREAPAMAFDSQRGVTVLFGGRLRGGEFVQDTWEWDGVEWHLRAETGPPPRYQHRLSYDTGRGVVVLLGGSTASVGRFTDTWDWDGNAWTSRASGGFRGRAEHGLVYDSQRAVTVSFGGSGPQDQSLGDCWEWNGQSWTLRSSGNPGARFDLAMAYDDRRGVTVLYSGFYGRTDTWEWDGAAWALRSQLGSLPLSGHAMVFDSSRGVTVRFGGVDGGSSMYEWNGVVWDAKNAPGPTPRRDHAMAYEASRQVTLLFGGLGYAGNLGDTWQWDGTNWTMVSSSGPAPRSGHAMAHDAERGVTVLFGGTDGAGTVFADTWEWDGSLWTQVATTGPSKRSGHAMIYDTGIAEVMLFGGGPGSYGFGDLWGWDGETWKAQGTLPSELWRRDHGMAFDNRRGVAVVFGGWQQILPLVKGDTIEIAECPRDSDGDGVRDRDDECARSAIGGVVRIGDCDTQVENALVSNGCTMMDRIAQCGDEARNHGEFVSCVTHLTNDWRREERISQEDRTRIQICAARSSVRKPLREVLLPGKLPLPVGGQR